MLLDCMELSVRLARAGVTAPQMKTLVAVFGVRGVSAATVPAAAARTTMAGLAAAVETELVGLAPGGLPVPSTGELVSAGCARLGLARPEEDESATVRAGLDRLATELGLEL